MSDELIQQVRALLDEMKTQATEGTMIPARVPGQIDAVRQLFDQIAAGSPAPANTPAVADGGAEDPADLVEQLRTEMSQFISTAVHEMRIPLTSIRGYSDMLDKQILGPLNEQQLEFMGIIRSNVLRMERLIADVNDISKIRANRLHVEPRMDMAKNIIMMAEKASAELAEERNQTVIYEVPEGLPILNVDGNRIAQALGALIQNALQYSPEGSTVTVTASNDNGQLRLAVRDEGIGMTVEDQTHLGEPFWRSEHEVIRAVKGHGLGYCVAKGVVELAGGQMFYETEFEKGSTFGFTLPGMS